MLVGWKFRELSLILFFDDCRIKILVLTILSDGFQSLTYVNGLNLKLLATKY